MTEQSEYLDKITAPERSVTELIWAELLGRDNCPCTVLGNIGPLPDEQLGGRDEDHLQGAFDVIRRDD